MAQMTIRERINFYSGIDETVYNIEEAIDYLRDAVDMMRYGYGNTISKIFNKPWKTVASEMEEIIRLENPEEARYIISEIYYN